MLLVTLFTGLNLGSLVGITHDHEHTAEAATKKCTTCGGVGTIPCTNIGVTTLKGNYTTQQNCIGCWECAKNKDNITTTITSGACYHCKVPTSDGGHGWTPSLVDCGACGGSTVCSLCGGDGCDACDWLGMCITCKGEGKVETVCPKCGGSGSYETIVRTACGVCGGDGLVGAYVCNKCGDKDDMIPKIDHEYPITCPDCTGTGEIEYTARYTVAVFVYWQNEGGGYSSPDEVITLVEHGDSYSQTFGGGEYEERTVEINEVTEDYEAEVYLNRKSGPTEAPKPTAPEPTVSHPTATPGPHNVKIDVQLQNSDGSWGEIQNRVDTTVKHGASYEKSFGSGEYAEYSVSISEVTEDYYELIAVARKTYTVTVEHIDVNTSSTLGKNSFTALSGKKIVAKEQASSFAGYTFSSSTGSGQVSKDKTVVCYYKGSGPIPEMCTLTVNQTGEGSTTGAGKYEKGATAELSAVPATGWVFSKWIGRKTAA